jgi:hypothetical protein
MLAVSCAANGVGSRFTRGVPQQAISAVPQVTLATVYDARLLLAEQRHGVLEFPPTADSVKN